MERDEIVQTFFELFEGYSKAYTSVSNFNKKENGKVEAKLLSVKGCISEDEKEEHLFGNKQSLGVIPLKEDNTVSFAVIDIDIINNITPLRHTIEEIEELLINFTLPLLPCKSKSGGIHLYIFFKEEIEASVVVSKLKEWIGLLGYAGAEVFPKQTKRANGSDVGNAINLPYFNSEDTDRWAIIKGKKISLEEFVKLAYLMRVTNEEFKNVNVEEKAGEEHKDAPPCIARLLIKGIEDGSRNNGVYDLGVYFKKKYPDTFQDEIMKVNGNLISPPLSPREIEATIKSLNNKDYFYKCKEYPICQYCDKEKCRARKYGLQTAGGNSHLFSNLTKYKSNEGSGGGVRWCISFDNERCELNTEELLCQIKLQKRILEDTNKVYRPVKQNNWIEEIETLTREGNIIIDPEDSSEKGQFNQLLNIFLTNRMPSDQKKSLLTNHTYLDPYTDEVYFKSLDLFTFLKNKRFIYQTQRVWSWLTDLGGSHKMIKIGGVQVRVWFLKMPERYDATLDEEEKL